MALTMPALPQEIQLRIIDFALDGEHDTPLLFGIAQTKSIAVNLALVSSAFLNQVIPVCQRRLCRLQEREEALAAREDEARSLFQKLEYTSRVTNEVKDSFERAAQYEHVIEERLALQALINRFSKVLRCIKEPQEFDQALDEASFSTADLSFADGTRDDPILLE